MASTGPARGGRGGRKSIRRRHKGPAWRRGEPRQSLAPGAAFLATRKGAVPPWRRELPRRVSGGHSCAPLPASAFRRACLPSSRLGRPSLLWRPAGSREPGVEGHTPHLGAVPTGGFCRARLQCLFLLQSQCPGPQPSQKSQVFYDEAHGCPWNTQLRRKGLPSCHSGVAEETPGRRVGGEALTATSLSASKSRRVGSFSLTSPWNAVCYSPWSGNPWEAFCMAHCRGAVPVCYHHPRNAGVQGRVETLLA